MEAAKKQLAEWDKELDQLHTRNGDLGLEVQNLREQLATVTSDREADKKSALAGEDPLDDADVLNQLKARDKKSKATLADIRKLREILGC